MRYRLRTTFGNLGLFFGFVLVVPCPALSSGLLGIETTGPGAAAAPGRLIVKYAAAVSRSPRQVLETQGRFEDFTGSASLDVLNEVLGVRSARSLAGSREHLGGKRATAAYLDRLAGVRFRFPTRAARAPAAARAPDLSNLYLVEIDPEIDVHEAAARYAADPAVLYAEPDYRVEVDLVPNDPYFSSTGTWGQAYKDLWALHKTRADQAWNVATGGGVVVAIVDTGIDRTHPDLSYNLWTNAVEIPGNGLDDDGNGFVDDTFGWDFAGDDNDPTDDNGHGTHVAGTVAATGDNGLGVVGMSWSAQVMPVQGLAADGYGWASDLIEAILYAAENGADVINNSWSGPGTSSGIADAVATARFLGAVVVAAAGNDGRSADFRSPGAEEGVITVAASDNDDAIAGFSNFGNSVNVAAPGVDILSVRAKDTSDLGGAPEGTDYLRLSGTSMASPHVAGLAAVLLSAMPSLSVDEVEWHLELNADQPGYPGYAGQAWNPHFGWGRINAARIFDTPPVTTRVGGALRPQHGFVDAAVPKTDSLDLVFTTTDSVPWTLTTPPWAQAVPHSGAASGPIDFSYDTTGLSVGPQNASVVIDAPSATDGGASLQASLYVHRDERLGPEIVLNPDNDGFSPSLAAGPVVASNGLGSMVVWTETAPIPWDSPYLMKAMYFGADGNASTPILVHDGRGGLPFPLVATDGRNYTVIWNQDLCRDDLCVGFRDEGVFMKRLGPDGQVLDPEPIEIYRGHGKPRRHLGASAIAFDGESYTLLLVRRNITLDRHTYYVLRIGVDGALSRKKHKIYRGDAANRRLACGRGSCLLVWSAITGTSPGGFYIRSLQSLQLIGGELVSDLPTVGASPYSLVMDVVSDGTDYLVVGTQHKICTGSDGEFICRWDVVGARVGADGSPLDSQSFILNHNSPLETDTRRDLWGAGFDGTNYIVPFGAIDYGGTKSTVNTFVTRVSTTGKILDTEDEGLLAFSHATFGDNRPSVAVNARSSVVLWRESGWTAAAIPRHHAVPMLARPPSADFVRAEIGSIGPHGVQEGEILRLALSATGLDPAATTFRASNLPVGASFDAPAGLFQWKPDGIDVGNHNAVHFEATDGATVVSEDVDITVGEAILSIGGTTTFAVDGSPAAGIALGLRGLPGQKRTVYTDANGRFRFEGLAAGRRYRVRLQRPSRKKYRSDPRAVSVAVGNSDNNSLALTVDAK